MTRPEDMSREALEDEVAFRRSELGICDDLTELATLRSAFMLTPTQVRTLQALYHAKGRTLSPLAIMEAASAGDPDDRCASLVGVWICFIRKALGANAISNTWGRGYAITPEGAAAVDRALSGRAGRSPAPKYEGGRR